jgi:chromosome segregation ATPase
MSKTLTYEQVMALFVKADERFAKGEKEIAEFRKSAAERDARADERFAKGEKEIAKLNEEAARLNEEAAKLNARTAEKFAKADERFAKGEKEMAEIRASIARLEAVAEKNNARLDENNARLDENNARLDKANAKLDENNAKLDRLDRKVGSQNNKLGGIIEHAVLPDIVKKFKEKGFNFKEVSVRVEILNESETKHLAEVDALLENGEFVIAVEAKTDMKISDVDAHVKRLEILRKHSRFSGKKIYGALATAVARKGPVDYALKHGFYVLQRPDILGVKILDFPKGRSAKAW